VGKDNLIFSRRFDRPTFEEIEEKMKNSDFVDDCTDLMTGDEFLEFVQKNRRAVPNEKRLADKDKFIWAVRELSETYQIDTDIRESDDGYTAYLYMQYASFNGFIKKLLNLIFILSDDFSMFSPKENQNCDVLMCFSYHTHNIYLKDRELTDFS
jgi:hypothetical protein